MSRSNLPDGRVVINLPRINTEPLPQDILHSSLSAGWTLPSTCGILVKEAMMGMNATRRTALGFLGTRVESVSALPMLQRCHIVHMTVPARCICLTCGTDASGRCVVSTALVEGAHGCGKPS